MSDQPYNTQEFSVIEIGRTNVDPDRLIATVRALKNANALLQEQLAGSQDAYSQLLATTSQVPEETESSGPGHWCELQGFNGDLCPACGKVLDETTD